MTARPLSFLRSSIAILAIRVDFPVPVFPITQTCLLLSTSLIPKMVSRFLKIVLAKKFTFFFSSSVIVMALGRLSGGSDNTDVPQAIVGVFILMEGKRQAVANSTI